MEISDMDSDGYDVDMDATDDEWVQSRKLRVKRNSKSGRSSGENTQSSNEASNVHDNSRGLFGAFGELDICCNCTKSSSCKTSKCKCRSMGNICRISCGCLETKCANRGLFLNEVPAQSEVVEGTGNSFDIDETDRDLATQGAELLQSALAKKPTETNNDHGPRKPLADIGNTEKSQGPKPNQRKKWRKSTILLVSDPPPPPQSENSEVPGRHNNSTSEANASVNSRSDKPLSRPENAAVAPRAEGGFTEMDVTLKIPRAMRKAAPSNGGAPLWDRNAGKPEESITKKESDLIDARSPIRPRRTLEKENHGR